MRIQQKFWHNQYTIPILVAFLIPSFVWGVTTIGESIVTGGQLTVSGTATSTIAGDLSVDDETFYVDTINNRVFIGTSTSATLYESITDLLTLNIPGDSDNGITISEGYWDGGHHGIRLYYSEDNNYGRLVGLNGASEVGGMYIPRSTGYFGLGDTSPDVPLEIVDSSSVGYLAVSSGADQDGDLFIVDENGNVGIGTASPDEAFQVSGNAKVTKLNITSGAPATNEELNVYGDAWFYTNNPTISFGNSLSQGTKLSGGNAEETILQATKASGDYGISLKTGVSPTTYLRINQTGNVGIGTTAPQSVLQVTGGGLCVGSDANCNSDNNTEGTVYAATTAMTTYDLAENYPTKDHTLAAGDVVALDTTQNGPYVKRAEQGDVIIGAISKQPGALLGGFNGVQYAHEKQVPVALSGRIDVKVTTENGEIKSGDYLELSSTPGIAAKATGKGKVIGIALESYSGEGVGEVLVFVESHDTTGLKNEIAELRALVESLR